MDFTNPNIVDANGWIEGMETAPKEQSILVVIPCTTEDGEPDYIHSIAWWVEPEEKMSGTRDGYWDGEWRYTSRFEGEEVIALGDLEPTHWKPLDLPVAYQQKEAA